MFRKLFKMLFRSHSQDKFFFIYMTFVLVPVLVVLVSSFDLARYSTVRVKGFGISSLHKYMYTHTVQRTVPK